MSRLVPFNAATCPHCGKKETKRVGFSEGKKGSVWMCTADGCSKPFVVPLLQLVKRAS